MYGRAQMVYVRIELIKIALCCKIARRNCEIIFKNGSMSSREFNKAAKKVSGFFTESIKRGSNILRKNFYMCVVESSIRTCYNLIIPSYT